MSSGILPVRSLGAQGLQASAQGLGAVGMSAAYFDNKFAGSEEESLKVIHRFRELASNTAALIDTADVYGPHTNEQLVGKAIDGQRSQSTIATKFGNVHKGDQRLVEGSPEYVKQAVQASLDRLKIDSIDLCYQHRVDRSRPIAETWQALKELVQEGKDEVIPTCRELGIGIVAFSPLGRGFLTGTIDDLNTLSETDMRVTSQPRFQQGNFEKNLQLVEQVKQLAAKKGVTPGQLALAWVHHQGEDVFPIPGTKRLKYLEENVAAFNVKLSKEELNELEAVFQGKVVGARYLPDGMKKAYYGDSGYFTSSKAPEP